MMLVLAGSAGCLLGATYVGWLWLDVRRFTASPLGPDRSSRWRGYPIGRGMLLRLAGIGVALLLISRAGGPNLLAALAGMILVRTVLIWRVSSSLTDWERRHA